jgi:hypothetical protein
MLVFGAFQESGRGYNQEENYKQKKVAGGWMLDAGYQQSTGGQGGV